MILYKVIAPGSANASRFILALNKTKAINKYLEQCMNVQWVTNVQCNEICYRDDIIPTVEPAMEFNNQLELEL